MISDMMIPKLEKYMRLNVVIIIILYNKIKEF